MTIADISFAEVRTNYLENIPSSSPLIMDKGNLCGLQAHSLLILCQDDGEDSSTQWQISLNIKRTNLAAEAR